MHGPRVRGQRLRQRRHVVPLVGLQVVGLHAGEVAALIPAPDHVEVLIQAAGEETGPPEEGGRRGEGGAKADGGRGVGKVGGISSDGAVLYNVG